MNRIFLRSVALMSTVGVSAAVDHRASADPPPNDICPDAITIGEVTNLPFSSVDATSDDPCWGCGIGWTFGPDIWYNYTAPSFGTVTVYTCGTNYWHVLAAYNGHGCPAGSLITCREDPQPSADCPANQIQFLATPGDQFKIRIGGWMPFCDPSRGQTGTGFLSVEFTPSSCGNPISGDCCQAGGNGTPYCNNGLCCQTVCDIMPFCCDLEWDEDCAILANSVCNVCICAAQPPEELCECAATFANNQVIPFVTEGANTDGPPACGDMQLDRWWNHTAVCNGILTVDTVDSNFGCVIALYDGWECPVTESRLLGCDSAIGGPSVSIPVRTGQKIKVRFGSSGGDTGEADLRVACAPYVCGLAGTGDCCDNAGTGTPMCDDAACCALVCAVDPYCCGGQWDEACAALAHIYCTTCPKKLTSDDCDFDGIPDEWITADSVYLGKLDQGDPAPLQGMGWSVALSGHALFGSRGDDDGSGAVYGFHMESNHGASLAAYKFKAADADAGDQFGYSLAISANLAAIGAPFDDEAGADAGAAYVFRDFYNGNNWQQRAKLMAADADPEDGFGNAIGISGNQALVGAPAEDSAVMDGGAVYAFTEQTPGEGDFVQTDKFVSNDIASLDAFGAAIAMSGSTAVIGAPGDDDNGDFSGSAYIFREVAPGDWQQIAKLIASDGAPLDVFGTSVAINDLADTVVVGAPSHHGAAPSSGAAYVFREVPADSGNWVEIAKLTASNAGASHRFGQSVSITGDFELGDTILVGAHGNESAYIFRESQPGVVPVTFEEIDILTAADGVAGDEFGRGVAIAGSRAVVGAWRHSHSGANLAGTGYNYVIRARDCNNNSIPDFCDITFGSSSDKNANNVPDECEPEPTTPGDLDDSGMVDVFDLFILLDNWGACPKPCPPHCPADITNATGTAPDCAVDVFDLFLLLANWSP